jgi:hypothetical protein
MRKLYTAIRAARQKAKCYRIGIAEKAALMAAREPGFTS